MDARAWREDGTRFQKRSRRRILQQTLPWGASRKGGTAHSEAGYFARSPEVSPTRADRRTKSVRVYWYPNGRSSFSIRLRRLYPFRAIQDRKSALQEASAADSMKMMVSRWGGYGWLEQLRKNWPVTASEEFVDAGNLIRYE